MEETTETINLVLPSSSPLGGGELSDQDLEAVSGAGGSWQILSGLRSGLHTALLKRISKRGNLK